MKRWIEAIRDIPDFPKKGIVFKDITTLLKKGELFKEVIEEMSNFCKKFDITAIVAAESRGFIFGAPIAVNLGLPFIPVRKKGKLPSEVVEVTYSLEYGEDTIAIHKDALNSNDNVILVDDLLATGGTAKAMEDLVKKLGAKIEYHLFLIELEFLKGKDKLSAPVKSFITF